MSICVYVGNLATSTTEAMIRTAFTEAGCSVGNVTIMRSAQNDRSRGFGFVEVGTTEAVTDAIQRMNGSTVDGRVVAVSEARVRPAPRGDRRSFQSYSGAGESGPRRNTGARRKAR
ncbi:MAG TPA: RNA-binding protein [Planctomycetota bacterium]